MTALNPVLGYDFYARLGFVHEGTLHGFYKRAHEDHDVDACVMGLLFNEDACPLA